MSKTIEQCVFSNAQSFGNVSLTTGIDNVSTFLPPSSSSCSSSDSDASEEIVQRGILFLIHRSILQNTLMGLTFCLEKAIVLLSIRLGKFIIQSASCLQSNFFCVQEGFVGKYTDLSQKEIASREENVSQKGGCIQNQFPR